MTSAETRKIRSVGVDLQAADDDTRRVVDAIRQDNPDSRVSQMPGLVRVQTPGAMVIRRATVESLLGREWETHEFQMAIVSYFGHISSWDDDEIVIKWEH
ncbi:MmoB/DmpM family protein [Streptomyces sp. NPDC096012]|uniref:MmoB/DmpM family protein n=1 Tax=Streptomyces sp. NPDC096012 TaxID=3155684 RepID=UPI003369F70A